MSFVPFFVVHRCDTHATRMTQIVCTHFFAIIRKAYNILVIRAASSNKITNLGLLHFIFLVEGQSSSPDLARAGNVQRVACSKLLNFADFSSVSTFFMSIERAKHTEVPLFYARFRFSAGILRVRSERKRTSSG